MSLRGNKLMGVLPGLAVGDALGATLEFKTHAEIVKKYPDGFREIVGGGVFHWDAGAPTDDTDLTLVLARSLARKKRLDLDNVATGMVRWLKKGPKDVGGTCSAAIRLLASGVSPSKSGRTVWESSPKRKHSKPAGNGSLMYAAPLALLHSGSPPSLQQRDVYRLSQLTHYDARCQAAVHIYLRAIALLAAGDAHAVQKAIFDGRHAAPGVARLLRRAAALPPEEHSVDGAGMGYVLTTLGLALSAVTHASSFEDGLVRVVMRGGDTDTNGAVAGALLGALFGEEGIPARWLERTKAVPELSALSRQILRNRGVR